MDGANETAGRVERIRRPAVVISGRAARAARLSWSLSGLMLLPAEKQSQQREQSHHE
jgi:hypothetical protein